MKRKISLRSIPVDKLKDHELQEVYSKLCEDFYLSRKALQHELNKRKIIRHKINAVIKECENRKNSMLFSNVPPISWFEQEYYRKMSEEYLSVLLDQGRNSEYYREMSICSFPKDILEDSGI
jgi:hypothetical protein